MIVEPHSSRPLGFEGKPMEPESRAVVTPEPPPTGAWDTIHKQSQRLATAGQEITPVVKYVPEGGKAFKNASVIASEKVAVQERAERETTDPYIYEKARERLAALQRQDSGEELDSRSQDRLNRYLNIIIEAQDRLANGTPQSDDEQFVRAYHDVFGPYIDQQEAQYLSAEEAAKVEERLDEPAPYTEEDERYWRELRDNPQRDAIQQFTFRQLDRHFGPLESARATAVETPPVAPERIPIPAEPDMTTILGRVEDGTPLSPEDQVIYDAWTARHADVINPGQIGAPETSEPTSPVENIGEPPEANPNPLEERPTADVDAEEAEEAERRNAAYDRVMEMVRLGVVLTDEDRRIIREHDDAVLHTPAASTSSATASSTTAETIVPPPSGSGGGVEATARNESGRWRGTPR